LSERAESRTDKTKQQGLTNCRFQEGDASDLYEVKDQTFDLVVSIVGAMFAPKPFDVDGQNKSASRDTTSIPATFLCVTVAV
jgi:hypothetical protein